MRKYQKLWRLDADGAYRWHWWDGLNRWFVEALVRDDVGPVSVRFTSRGLDRERRIDAIKNSDAMEVVFRWKRLGGPDYTKHDLALKFVEALERDASLWRPSESTNGVKDE